MSRVSTVQKINRHSPASNIATRNAAKFCYDKIVKLKTLPRSKEEVKKIFSDELKILTILTKDSKGVLTPLSPSFHIQSSPYYGSNRRA